jgi:hypothetical protein
MKPPQPNAPVPLHEDPRLRFLVMASPEQGSVPTIGNYKVVANRIRTPRFRECRRS